MRLSDGVKYLKASEIQSGEVVTIKNEGEWVTSTKFKYPDGNFQQQFVLTVEYQGQDYRMNVNKGNRQILIKAYGSETSKWVGQRMKLNTLMALVSGKKILVFDVEPIKGVKTPGVTMGQDNPEELIDEVEL